MQSEIQSRAKFSEVRYANCWEDADVLLEALEPAGKRCLSIGSAGDNSFSLLAAGAQSVDVVEMNPAQVACIELRLAAYKNLEYDDFLGLLGSRSADRLSLYEKCLSDLSQSSQDFWAHRRSVIRRGFQHAGKFERYFHIFRRFVLPLVHNKKRIDFLLSHNNRTPSVFYRERWDTWRWRALFRVFFSRTVMGWAGRSPAFFDFVEGPVADRILGRVQHALSELLPVENPYLRYILRGSYEDALPHALRRDNYELVRENLPRLSILQTTLEELSRTKRAHGDHYEAYNLSDIFEYMSPEGYCKLLKDLLRISRPGARLAYWNMLAPRSCPEQLATEIRSLDELSSALFAMDKAFFYSRFIVEEVI